MKKSKSRVRLFRGLSAVLASLFILMLCLTTMANANSSVINRELGLTNFVTEQGESNQIPPILNLLSAPSPSWKKQSMNWRFPSERKAASF